VDVLGVVGVAVVVGRVGVIVEMGVEGLEE
jgi:hypothetical protein